MRSKILTVIVYVCVFVNVIQAAPIRILGIGNSFTMDAMGRELQPIFTSEAQDVILGYPFRGGTWLSQHDAWSSRTDTMPYNYYEYRNGVQTTTGTSSYNLTMAVEHEPWDYVIIQSDHDSAGIYKSYEPYLTHLVDFVKKHCSNKNVKIGFYMTWAYDSISTYSAFKYYKYNNPLMYDSIIACAQKVMASHPEFFLIPCGTAVQNARTSYMGHRMNRDGYHLNYSYGNYTAALSWYRAIMGKDPKDITYYPGAISEYCAHMCQAAVHEAFEKPYEVTSLKEEFGRSEGDVQAADESRLRRVTFNGMNVPIVDGQDTYIVPVDTAIHPVCMYSYPHSTKAAQNITDKAGSDVPFDPDRYGYYPLITPALGDTVVYTNKVFAEDKVHITTYTFCLVGTTADKIVYPISSKEDLEDFAATVNGGRYGIHGRLTNYQRQLRDTVRSDQGIRVRYCGDIESDGVQQGGIKSLAFDWRVSGKNNPVNYRVKVGNKVQTYATDPVGSDAIVKHYAYDFRQTSNTAMAISVAEKQAVNQTFVIVGPVTITPYLLYTQYTDTVTLPLASYDCTSPHMLINNTDGEGEVTYAIQADSTAQASIQDGILDLSAITRAGDIIVKASWNEGKVFTTFTLHVKAGTDPTDLTDQFTDSPIHRFTKMIKDNQILILRHGQLFDLLGRPVNANVN